MHAIAVSVFFKPGFKKLLHYNNFSMKKIATSSLLSIAVALFTVSSAAAALDVVLGPASAPGPAPVSFCSLYTHFNCSTTCTKCVSRCIDPSVTNFSCGRAVNRTVIVTCTCGDLTRPPSTLVPPSPPPTAPKSQPLALATPKSGSPAVEVTYRMNYAPVICDSCYFFKNEFSLTGSPFFFAAFDSSHTGTFIDRDGYHTYYVSTLIEQALRLGISNPNCVKNEQVSTNFHFSLRQREVVLCYNRRVVYKMYAL